MEKWFLKNRKADYEKMSKQFKINKLLCKILINRNIKDYDSINSFLNPKIDKLYSPKKMKDLVKGVEIIKEKIKQNNKIRIVGDYDVDGVISTFILYTALSKCLANVDYMIPDRVRDGYGINNRIIEQAQEDKVDTIITCDNGIAAIEPIKLAKKYGITVIVTDHHDIPFVIDQNGEKKFLSSDADAIIDPKQKECRYPFEKLCGAGVAFKFIQQLYEEMKIPKEELYKLIGFVAIATVCDIVDLVDENRIFVKNGFKLIINTDNIGLKSLIKATGLKPENINVYTIGFVIGPCINASGRLDNASLALELLLTGSIERAEEIAEKLKNLNEERKNMTEKGVAKVIEKIENSNNINDKIFVIYEPKIHESIAGIIAGRIKDKYSIPTIILTKTLDGKVKGSGRSIPEYNMFEEISKCKDLLNKFGGHPMAAGLSLEESNINKFRKRLNDKTSLNDDDLIPKVYIDAQLPLDYVNFSLVNYLKILEPFGKGNCKPLFGEKNIKVKKGFILGKNRNVLKLKLITRYGNIIDGIYFGDINEFENNVLQKYGKEELSKLYCGMLNKILLDIIYTPSINEYKDNKYLQVVIQNYRLN